MDQLTRIACISRILMLVVALGMTALSAFAYYERYYQWRGCFNALGRCYDSRTATVYLEQAGLVWGMFALLGTGLSVLLMRSLWVKGCR